MLGYEYEQRATMGGIFNGQSITTDLIPLDGRWYTPEIQVGDARGFVRLPIWMIGGGGAAVCAVGVAITRRRLPFVGGLLVWSSGVLLVASIGSLGVYDSDSLPRIGRIGGVSFGVGCDAGGLIAWHGEEGRLQGRELSLRRRAARDTLDGDTYPMRRPDVLSSQVGWWWLQVGRAEITQGSRTVHEFVLVPWALAAGLAGVPTLVACWRSRWVGESAGCPACGYSREGLRAGICPECGETSGGGA